MLILIKTISAINYRSSGILFSSCKMEINTQGVEDFINDQTKDGWDVDQIMPFSWGGTNETTRTDLIWILFSRPKN